MTKPVPMGVGKGSEDNRTPDHKRRRQAPIWDKLGKNKISKLADELEKKKDKRE